LTIRRSPRSIKAFTKAIRDLKRPVLQEADLAVAFLSAQDDPQALSDIPCPQIRQSFRRHVETLVDFGALEPYIVQSETLGYQLPLHKGTIPAEEICSLDLFCYISHLSALSWHGLTDRLPKTIFLSRPSRKQWRALADARAEGELGPAAHLYFHCKLPKYRFVEFTRVRKHLVQTWSSTRLDRELQSAFKRVESPQIRVATIGRCFLDMVRSPELCGGIHHVMETYEEHAARYLNLIVSEIDAHGTKVEQARAGYLIERVITKSNPVINKWSTAVVRGGSRKLDPSAEYSEEFSERWALSINA
jgi:predicted transcriptional regulator of viral defense system